MIVDMKYHIASMVAVFLALGVGILVGSAMVGDSVLMEQQERIIDRLEVDFAELRASREDLSGRLATLEKLLAASFELEDETYTRLARGKLLGKRVAVIVSSDGMSREDVDRVCQAIDSAGGTVTWVMRIRKRLEPVSGDEARDVALACGLTGTSPQEVGRGAAEAIALCAALGEVNPCVLALVTLGYVTLDRDVVGRVNAVVIAGGGRDPASDVMRVDIPVVRALRRVNITAVGIEPAGVRFSYIKDYKREGIATVDCADTPLGRLSLIYVLAGGWGHFGIKDTAENLAPRVFSE